MSVWEWADKNRVLPRETSKEPGEWRTDRNPPLRAIMESLSPHSGAEEVTFVAGTQIGKTETGTNFVGYVIDHEPATIVVVQPTSTLGKVWRRQRFDPLTELTSSVGDRIGNRRSRDSNNTLEAVKFPGGWLIVAHAESAASLSMYSARYLFLDEVDSYPLDTGGEGDPLRTAESRTDSFGRMRKIFRVSSPKKLLGASLIWREYLAGDQRECYVPCPRCDEYQILLDENLLPGGEYLCQHCGQAIPHSAKTDMIAEHQWRAAFPERISHHSYRLPSHYAPIGLGRTWKELYDERAAAKDDPRLVKAYVSRRCAIPYESADGKVDPDDLRTTKEEWRMREIPPGVLRLTAGIDVQSNRLHIVIVGWSRGPQAWIIDRYELSGSPLEPETWKHLREYLNEPLANAYGTVVPIDRRAIDAGNWQSIVLGFCHEYRIDGYIAIKGDKNLSRKIIGKPTFKDVSIRGRTLRRGAALYVLGVNDGKDTILDGLALNPTRARSDRLVHIPSDIPDEWFDQITAERRDPQTGRWEKVKSYARNEDTDALIYAYAAACHAQNNLLRYREAKWTQLEEKYQPRNGDLFAEQPPVDNEPPPSAKRQQPPAKRRGSFVESWRL